MLHTNVVRRPGRRLLAVGAATSAVVSVLAAPGLAEADIEAWAEALIPDPVCPGVRLIADFGAIATGDEVVTVRRRYHIEDRWGDVIWSSDCADETLLPNESASLRLSLDMDDMPLPAEYFLVLELWDGADCGEGDLTSAVASFDWSVPDPVFDSGRIAFSACADPTTPTARLRVRRFREVGETVACPKAEDAIAAQVDHPVDPQFSPNGRYLVFSGLRKGEHVDEVPWRAFDIYLYDFLFDRVRNLSEEAELGYGGDEEPSFHPASDLIVFTRERSELYGIAFTSNTASATRLTYDQGGQTIVERGPRYAPEGRSILYWSGDGVWLYDLEDHGRRLVADIHFGLHDALDREPIWLDADRVVYVSEDTINPHPAPDEEQTYDGDLRLRTLSTGGDTLLPGVFRTIVEEADPFRLGEQHLGFSSDVDGDFDIWIGELATGRAWPLDFRSEPGMHHLGGCYTDRVVRDCPGDADGDYDVDISDLGIVLASFEVDDGGDVDHDGDTDISDLGLLLAHFEMDCGLTPDPWRTVAIPAGAFAMGDHSGNGWIDELPVHDVYLDAFHMHAYETAVGQYEQFLNEALAEGLIEVRGGTVYRTGTDVRYFTTSLADDGSRITFEDGAFIGRDRDHPVTFVSWYGAAAYANWLSERNGRQPCYNLDTWACNFNVNGYRLPTEAEWEYAARGGAHDPYFMRPWGDDLHGSYANFRDSGDSYDLLDPATTPVGHYDGGQTPLGEDMANGYGLYDMAGNVSEWVNDWYETFYYRHSTYDNPVGPLHALYKSIRDGHWDSVGGLILRCADRSWGSAEWGRDTVGFRLVHRDPDPTPG